MLRILTVLLVLLAGWTSCSKNSDTGSHTNPLLTRAPWISFQVDTVTYSSNQILISDSALHYGVSLMRLQPLTFFSDGTVTLVGPGDLVAPTTYYGKWSMRSDSLSYSFVTHASDITLLSQDSLKLTFPYAQNAGGSLVKLIFTFIH